MKKWKANKKEYTKKWFKNIPVAKALLYSARGRAKRQGLECSLEEVDIVVPEFCPYLGMRLERSDIVQSDSSPSLDRIDPTQGYVKNNIEVISYKANSMKSNASIDEQIRFAKEIFRRYVS